MSRFFRNNGGLLLIAAVLLAGVLAVGAYILGFDPLTSALEVLTTPFRAASSAVANWTEEQYDRAFRYEELAAENEALRQRVAELERDAIAGQDAQRENERMKDLLGLAEERPELQYRDAAVVRRSSDNWRSDLTIDRGTLGGVEVNDCVIDQYGNLVGVISEVGLNWSTLITVVDVDLEMGGLIARTDGAAIIEGDFALMSQGKLKLTYLPEGTQLLAGDTILTSGLRSGGTATYPSGLVVGYVEQMRSDDSNMNDYAILTPAAALDKLEQVFVINSFEVVD